MAKLTDAQLKMWVKAGKRIAGKSDGAGLTFTLSARGTATWVMRYRHGGRPRELTLGNYPDVSLSDARRAAGPARARIDAGFDVATEKRAARSSAARARSFGVVAQEYLDRAGQALQPKTLREIERYLKKDLLPKLGHLRAEHVGPQEVVDAIERIAERSDSVARHAFEILSIIFAHGLARHSVKANPCAGLRISSILGPRPARRARLKLSDNELRATLAGLPGLGRVNALCARILLATCVRKGELVRARKALVDIAGRTWTVPAEHSKNGRPFTIPLAPAVVGWFEELLALSGESQWLLPAFSHRGRIEDRHMSDKTLNAALTRCPIIGVREFSPHDLRSTARSHLAELGVDVVVAERCLNHNLGGLVAVYDQHDYLNERRRALELWAARLVELEPGPASNVVALRPAA